jgi:hypothetical protein
MLEPKPLNSSSEIQNEVFSSSPRLAATETAKALSLNDNRSEYYRLRSILEQSLNEIFPEERRIERIASAPGGRDLEKHAVRYLRSVGWS